MVDSMKDNTRSLFIRGIRFDRKNMPADHYFHTIKALQTDGIFFSSPVTFLVGENGTGKSTVLETIAEKAGFNREGGTKNYRFATYEEENVLAEYSTLIRGSRKEKWGYFLRAESFFNVATKEEEYAREGGKRSLELHSMSHGESFLELAGAGFDETGLYLLDEPEAALSVQRQLAMMVVIERSVRKGSQFLIVSHSPILLGYPGAQILSFDDGPVHETVWEDTESYRLTRLFLTRRESILRNLFDDHPEGD